MTAKKIITKLLKSSMLTAVAVTALGCSDGSDEDAADSRNSDDRETSNETQSPQCDNPSGYVAFDSANHENQDIRLSVHEQMNTLMNEGNFDEAMELYFDESRSADLRTKVLGRLDERLEEAPPEGERIDATIVAWLEFGARDDATELEQAVAKQWVDKSLLEFFRLSVNHEMLEGAREKWDEAFGYFGSKSENDEDDLLGLAQTAFKRDSTNGTTLGARVFNGLIDGACTLDTVLRDEDSDEVDVRDHEELWDQIVEINEQLELILAYSAGHEAFEMLELLEDGAEDMQGLHVKAAELQGFFLPIERLLMEQGGESAERGRQLRELLGVMPDAQPSSEALEDSTWTQDADPEMFLELLEEEFGIEIKG